MQQSLLELRCGKHTSGFHCQWSQDDNEVRLAEESREIDSNTAEFFFSFRVVSSVCVEETHVESFGAPGDFKTDAPQPDNAKRGVMYITSEKRKRIPRSPSAFTYNAFSLSESSGNC